MPKQQVPKIDIMTPELAAALDRANVISRMATYIIAALLSSLNIDCASVNFSHVTIHRSQVNEIKTPKEKKISSFFETP
ncbi:Protein of unknown function [Cotesia congregata]|uniref:Uncharacterized protein n=1 Tax=Cotesia congregata TaxID=51543 RepID=A0A8J2HSM0_COTCN|nr:Protein of unknown function [Cotesia congregata]